MLGNELELLREILLSPYASLNVNVATDVLRYRLSMIDVLGG
jgi:hypothetical protein